MTNESAIPIRCRSVKVSRSASSAVKTSHLVKRLSRLSSPMRASHAPICTSLKFLVSVSVRNVSASTRTRDTRSALLTFRASPEFCLKSLLFTFRDFGSAACSEWNAMPCQPLSVTRQTFREQHDCS